MSDNAVTPSRATTVHGIRERMARFRSTEGNAYAAAFRPRANDVIIATYPKSGTTWMQQIVHALRTNGDMDFGEITEVVPWIEMAYDLGLDLGAEQRGAPRAFKSHASGDTVPSGARYIVIVRDPLDVMLSFHRFFEGWIFEAGSIDVDTFARDFFLSGSRSGDYWSHLLSWWQRPGPEPVLLLAYEEMLESLEDAVSMVADFLGVSDERHRASALECASYATMRAHREKFDDHLVRARRDAACGLPPGGSSDKVASGPHGADRPAPSAAVVAQIEARWVEVLKPATGFADYRALLESLPSERARRQA